MLKESLRVWVLDGEGNKVAFPNDKEQAVLSNWQYTAERMAGAPTITDSIMHTQCLDDLWTKKEFVELNEDRFYISQVPTSEKDTDDVRYEHKVTFVSERSILENVFFFDCVTKEAGAQASDKPRSNTTDFSFFGTLTELVERLNDSLSYSHLYDAEGINGFRIVIDSDIADTEAKEVTISDAYFATAMQEIYNVFDIPYYWDGKTCHVGFAKNEIEEPFEYGKDKGLLSVTKENSDFRIINRITGMGSSDNIPYYYPNDDPNGEAKLKTYNFSSDRIKSFALSILSKYVGNGMVGSRITLCDVAENTNELMLFDGENISQANDVTRMHQAQLGGIYPDSGFEIDDPKFEVSMSFKVTATRGDVIDMSGLEIKLESGYSRQGSGAWLGTPLTRMDSSQMSVGFDCICSITLPDGTTEIYSSYDKRYDCVLSGTYTITFKCLSFYDISWTPVLDEKDNSSFTVWAKLTPYGKVVYTPKLAGKKVWRVDGTNNFAELDEGLITVDTYDGIPPLPMEYRILDDNNAIGFVVSEDGDEQVAACVEVTDIEYIQPMSNLMPSVYRDTKGEERFYNALDNTYILEGETDYHKFTNPFVEGEPKEGIQDFEDIKPTINNASNELGELFGEIADVAFDDNDSDDMAIEGENSTTAMPLHSYFYVKLHRFSGEFGFNLFKQGLAQGAMTFNFISGSCAGCAFEVGVPEGKQVGNHYEFENPVQVDEAGNIVDGNYDDKVKKNNPISSQQDTSTNSVWIALKKDNSTFGVLMPNATNNYRPKVGDKFVITNILLPKVYITAAEKRLESALIKYMSENNDEKFTFSIKFSRIYLQRNPDIAASINENSKIHVKYNGHDYHLYVSSYSRKCDDNILDEVSVELSENLTIAQSKSQQQMDSILGNVNEQISNIKNQGGAIIGGGIGQGDGNVDLTDVYRQVYNKLSKVVDDVANGKITFKRGADFGVFTSGLTGTGGMVDAKGNAELNSLYVRQFISAPKFVFNQVNVTNAEQWNTNGYGTIESVDLARKRITLRLEENEYGSVCIGDICRGIFADIGNVYGSGSNVEGDLDDCNFVVHRGFFTAYFYVRSVIENSKGRCVFEYGKKSPDGPDPCAFMDFAQYGSFNDESRQSSIYFSSRGRSYIEVLDGVKTWDIQHANRVCRYGWLGNLTVEYKDGRTVQLKGNGLFAQNNIYFGGNIEWLHGLKEVEDLKELATAYDVSLSQYQSVVTVDDMGNVINGLYTEDEAKTTKQYRISTAVFVRKGTQILLEEDPNNEDVTEGHYRLHTISDDCSTVVENSTVFVTGIRNIKDGVADTEDDATFDYDEMRKMSDAYIQVVVDLEGKTTKTVAMPIRIQHNSLPFMVCDLTNQAAQVSWNTKTGKYIGLPIQSTVNLTYHNEPWEISECKVVGGMPSGLAATITRNANGKSYDISINGTFAADTLPQVSNVQITVIGRYAGANYEYTKVLTIAKSADVVTYDVVPSVDSIVVDKFDGMSASLVSCDVYCNSSDDKRYKLTALPDGYTLRYGIDTDTPTIAIAPGTAISVTASNKKVVFALYDNNGTVCDSEDVPVLAWGKDGKGIEYIFYLSQSETPPSNPTPSDWSTNSSYQSQTTEYVPTWLGWTDDPSGVSAAFQYEYVAIRTSINGVWQPFSDPALHDHYGKHAPRATVSDNIITIPTDSKGNALIAFSERINFSLLVDARACTISSITKSGPLSNVACSISSSGGYADISCIESAELGNQAQTLNFTVVGTLDGASYQDTVTVKIVPNVTGEDGDGYEYVYFLCDESKIPTTAPVRSSGSLSSENGIQWVDDMPTMTDTKRYIYVAWKTGIIGSDGTFSKPKLFLYKAKDGVGEVSAYQMVETMPTLKPTTVDYEAFLAAAGTTSLGNGWTKQIVKQGAKMVLGGTVMNVSGNNSAWTSYTDGGYTWWKSAAINNSETTSMRISFTTSEDNMRVTFYLKAYSESYDKIALSTLDSSTINSNTAIGGNGVSSGAIYFDVEKAGTHYVTVQYSKDSSVSSYLDSGLVRMATNECYVLRYPPIYRCHGTVEEKVITWGDITKETGDQGDKGDKGDKGDQGEQGDRGYNGCIFRTSEWKPNTEYRNDSEEDDDGVKYIDIVYIENESATYGWDIYQCETTHTSGSSFSSTYWQKFSNLTPIYTPLIVAKGAVFKFAQGQQFNIMENNTIWGSFRHVPNDTDYAFWIGGYMGSVAPFAVTKGGKLVAANAEITGTITAQQGAIGGFTINNASIGNASGMSSNDGMSLFESFICFNDHASSAVRQAVLGTSAYNGSNFLCRLIDTGSTYDDHLGILFDIRNSLWNRNYAFTGNGNGVLNGVIQGYKLNVVTATGYINLANGNNILVNSITGNGTVYLPTATNVQDALGIGSSTDFALDIYIMAGAGTDFDVAGGSSFTLYDNNRVSKVWSMEEGDTLHLKLIRNGSTCCAYTISHLS